MTAAHVLFKDLKLQKKIIERKDSEGNEVEGVIDDEKRNNQNNSNQSLNNTKREANVPRLTTLSTISNDYDDNLADYDEFNTNPLIPAVYDLEVDFALIPLLSKNSNTNINNDCNNDNDNILEDMRGEVFMIEKAMSEEWESWNANKLEIGTLIAKLGIKTGFTIGKFKGIGSTIANDEDIQYHNCIIVEPITENCRFCLPGDSGSLYFARDPSYDNECNNINTSHYGKTYWKPIGIHRTSDSIYSSTKNSYACSFTECLKKLKDNFKFALICEYEIFGKLP